MRVENVHEPIGRVKCVVDNCEYWAAGNHCTASNIEVQGMNSSTTEETDCATFRPRDSKPQLR